MTREEVIRLATGLRIDFKCESETMVDFCDTIIKVFTHQPCDDCISREAVLEFIEKQIDHSLWAFEKLVNGIKNMSSVTPQPKIGKWIVTSEFEDCRYVKCNQCKVIQVFYYNKLLTNYCPNCGVKMAESEDKDADIY